MPHGPVLPLGCARSHPLPAWHLFRFLGCLSLLALPPRHLSSHARRQRLPGRVPARHIRQRLWRQCRLAVLQVLPQGHLQRRPCCALLPWLRPLRPRLCQLRSGRCRPLHLPGLRPWHTSSSCRRQQLHARAPRHLFQPRRHHLKRLRAGHLPQRARGHTPGRLQRLPHWQEHSRLWRHCPHPVPYTTLRLRPGRAAHSASACQQPRLLPACLRPAAALRSLPHLPH